MRDCTGETAPQQKLKPIHERGPANPPPAEVGTWSTDDEPLGCVAKRGCVSATSQRVTDMRGEQQPVCRHCRSQPLEFPVGGGVVVKPNLHAYTKSAYAGSSVGNGWSGAAAGCP